MSLPAESPPVTLYQEVGRAVQSGDLGSARTLCARLNADFPQFLPGWHSASFIALALGQVASAADLIQRALAGAPAEPRYLLQHARCLAASKRLAESLEAAAAAQRNAADDDALLDAIGSFYNSIGEHAQALEAYSGAIAANPRHSVYWFNRATVRRFLGQLAEAEADYDRAISLRPDDYEAYANRSELRRQTTDSNHVVALERLLAEGIEQWRGEVQIRYALAKEYEDLGQYGRSWQHLERGARLRRRHLRYDVGHDVATVEWIIEAFPQAPAEPIAGNPSSEPIFIIGLPRSGSTLVERILGSHSQVLAAGELNHFAAALVAAARARNGGQPLPRRQLVSATRELDFAALGTDYLERTRPATAQRPRFTDKMPLNYLYCGLIRRALPNARILHVTRKPMAVCYAMFKTLFRDGYPFSYDLGDIARYYAGYRRLMDHWRESMPGVIHDVSYESLVADQASETRRLLIACGLEWQQACLEFHRNPSATTTASASQVRRQLYDSSVDQWRHYEGPLEQLRTQLRAAGISGTELD